MRFMEFWYAYVSIISGLVIITFSVTRLRKGEYRKDSNIVALISGVAIVVFSAFYLIRHLTR